MGRYEKTPSRRRRRRRRSPVGPIIVILLLITLVAVLGTVMLRSCSKAEEISPDREAAAPQTEAPTAPVDIIPITEPSVETTTEATTEATTEPTTEATTEPTTAPTEAPTEPTTVPPTEPPVVVTEPPSAEEKAVGQQIADLAMAQVGKPYVYGGVGPDAFDASGFIIYCVGQTTGTSLPHSTAMQANRGERVAREDLQPGDVVFFWTSDPEAVEFVGVYVGGGQFVAARNPEKPVSQLDMTLDYFNEHYLFACRYW